jgi:hypothetical protein
VTGNRADDIVVFQVTRDARCDGCGGELYAGAMVRPERGPDGSRPLCLACADLDHLVLVPRGDAALTRRAWAASGLRAVVLRWSRSRRRYERQGILVEEEALQQAEAACLSDEEARAARRKREAERRRALDAAYVDAFAAAVARRYPGAPPGTARAVAEHACSIHSGRVGRSAAAKRLDPEAIDLAVRAHVRHRFTDYDGHLMRGVERDEARAMVADRVEAILAAWRGDAADA